MEEVLRIHDKEVEILKRKNRQDSINHIKEIERRDKEIADLIAINDKLTAENKKVKAENEELRSTIILIMDGGIKSKAGFIIKANNSNNLNYNTKAYNVKHLKTLNITIAGSSQDKRSLIIQLYHNDNEKPLSNYTATVILKNGKTNYVFDTGKPPLQKLKAGNYLVKLLDSNEREIHSETFTLK